MKRIYWIIPLVIAALLIVAGVVGAQGKDVGASQPSALASTPIGSAFTYQGQLKSNGRPVIGLCDFSFSLWDAAGSGSPPTGGTPIGATQTITNVSVNNGLFTVILNMSGEFGPAAFNGNARWLDISVRCPAGSGNYTALSPRQALTPAPMALALPGLYTTQNITSPNIIGGYGGNVVNPTVVGGTIGGGGASGFVNQVWANYATVGGGFGNIASNPYATVGGGAGNGAGAGAFVGGGGWDGFTMGGNYAMGNASTIGGGMRNNAIGNKSTIGGGEYNITNNTYATIGGGRNNTVSGDIDTVGGGQVNFASGRASTIDGGENNTASNNYATVGGGYINTASGSGSIIGGGISNTASIDYATIGGGYVNTASGLGSTIGGGYSNTASITYTTIGGGYDNTASNVFATIGGGVINTASGENSTISGGGSNRARGFFATVPGGIGNTADGDYSFAAGSYAKANHQGAFVWGDSTNANFASTANNQFLIRATGGVGINTNTPNATLNVSGTVRLNKNDLYLREGTDTNHGLGYYGAGKTFASVPVDGPVLYGYSGGALGTVQSGVQHIALIWTPAGTVSIIGLGSAGSTNLCLNGLNQFASCSSSLRYKNNVNDLTLGLGTIAKLHPVTFNWKDSGQADLGFVAEEVHQVTPLLTTLNEEGQIEGVKYDRITAVLVKGIQEQQQQIADLKAQNASLEARMAALEQALPANNTSTHSDATGIPAMIVLGMLLGLIIVRQPWKGVQ